MPEPEADAGARDAAARSRTILAGPWTSLAPLRLNGVLLQSPSIGNSTAHRRDAVAAQPMVSRRRGHAGRRAQAVLKKFGLGWWNIDLRLYGYDEVNEANARIIKNAFAKHTKQEFEVRGGISGDPIANSGAGIPSTNALQMVNWRGGRGGHIGFSPVMPPTSEHVLKQFHSTRKRYEEIGVDYYGSFTLWSATRRMST